MSLQRIIIDADVTADGFKSICPLNMGGVEAVNSLGNYVDAVAGGLQDAELKVNVGVVKASASITSTGAAVADETLVVGNVTFTAKASGATGNEFNVSATPATQAANIAAAINANVALQGVVRATAVLGVVTLVSEVPGKVGNAIALSETLTNVAISGFSGGADGTAYVLNRK